MREENTVRMMTDRLSAIGKWAIMIAAFMFMVMVSSYAVATPAVTGIGAVGSVSEVGGFPHENREVRKYHRRNKKAFHCSLCPAKGLKKLMPKRWR